MTQLLSSVFGTLVSLLAFIAGSEVFKVIAFSFLFISLFCFMLSGFWSTDYDS